MIRPTPTPIAPAPEEVNLAPEEHARLIRVMNAGTTIVSEQQLTTAARKARNLLLTAYTPWIIRVSAKSAPTDGGRADSAAEALIRATEALPLYNPDLGVPLGAFLLTSKTVVGEAVAEAGRSLALAGLAQTRLARSRGTEAPYLAAASLDEPRGADGATFGDSIPAEDDEADVGAALTAASISADVHRHLEHLSAFHRGLLFDRFGLGMLDPMTLEEMSDDRGVNISSISRGVTRAIAAFTTAAASLSTRNLITDRN